MCSLQDRTTEQLGDDLAALSAQLASALCRWLLVLAEFDRRSGWSATGARSCAEWLAWRCAMSPGAAREHVRVARRLVDLPRTTALFGRGELSYSKVRAITRLEHVEHEDDLLGMARDATAAQLEHVVRGYRSVVRREADQGAAHARRFLRLRDEEDGSVRLSGRLTAEEGAVLRAAIDAARDELWSKQRGTPDAAAEPDEPATAGAAGDADALVLLADVALAAPALVGRSAPERHQVVIHVDAAALGGVGPGALAPSVVRRLCCDATLVTALDGGGKSLDVGRRTRAVPPAMRRALLRRDGGCRFPGCRATRRLDAHHVEHWADGGATNTANLLSLCRHHHRALHESGFGVRLTPDGTPEFRRPDGTPIPVHPRPPCVAERTRLRRRAPAGTLAPGSNQRYDRRDAVEAFLRVAPPSTHSSIAGHGP